MDKKNYAPSNKIKKQMNRWIAESDETKRKAYIQIAEKVGMSPFAVEKDWWVTQTLFIIFGMEV